MARAVPPALVAKPAPEPEPGRRSPAVLIAPVLIAALLLVGAVFSRQGSFTGLFEQNATAVNQASIVLLPVVDAGRTAAEQSIVPDTGGDPLAVSGITCPLPDGWIPYTVNPTDSLFRLSILHGITLDEIRGVNCLSEDAVLLPSQVIYVPKVVAATLTPLIPTLVPTSVPLQIVNPPAPAPQPEPVKDDDSDNDEEAAPPPPPPPAKPTAVVTEDPTKPPPPPPTETPPPSSGGGGNDDDRGRGGGGKDDDRGGGKGGGNDDDRDRGGGGKGGGKDDGDRDRGGGGKGGGGNNDDGGRDRGGGGGRGGGRKGGD